MEHMEGNATFDQLPVMLTEFLNFFEGIKE